MSNVTVIFTLVLKSNQEINIVLINKKSLNEFSAFAVRRVSFGGRFQWRPDVLPAQTAKRYWPVDVYRAVQCNVVVHTELQLITPYPSLTELHIEKLKCKASATWKQWLYLIIAVANAPIIYALQFNVVYFDSIRSCKSYIV